jgi:putative DNA primase/helicase
MDKKAAGQYRLALEQYQIDKAIYDNAVKAAIKNGAAPVGLSIPAEPAMTRYMVNDSTYESLVAIAAVNPNGFLVWRDELVGWFHSLNKENQKEARGLYLTGWSGTEGYATDRIGRGHVRADRVNLSLLGTIQPNVLRQIVYDAVAGGGGDDGLVARFQLAVYPDPTRTYVKVDRRPDLQAMQHYVDLIQKLVHLDPSAVGASYTYDGVAYLPFDEPAQVIFDAWRQELEDRIRAPDSEEHPAMLAHLGKYRSLFPKLALVLHLADGQVGPIGRNAAIRASVWTEYLEAHARRIYHTATNRAMQSAAALANKIKAGKLADGFTKSDVLVKEWAGLRTAEEVGTALTVLRDMNWLTAIEDRRTGGRPAERFYISPKVKRAA